MFKSILRSGRSTVRIQSGKRASTLMRAASTSRVREPWKDPLVISHTLNVLESFKRKVGRPLHPSLDGLDPSKLAEAAYKGPFVLVSHNTDADPLFNYCNRVASHLWELPWDEFIGLPSRKSAEAIQGIQSDRNTALATALEAGYFDGYEGWRVSASGKRFLLQKAILWNVEGPTGARLGQAATFVTWKLEDGSVEGPGIDPTPAHIERAAAAVAAQSAAVRDLKAQPGAGESETRLADAVERLTFLKGALEGLERRRAQAEAAADASPRAGL